MKRIYFFNDLATSVRNGIGTYLDTMIRCCTDLCVDIEIFNFNASVEELTRANIDGVWQTMFPKLGARVFMLEYETIDRVMQLYVKDSSENVFLLNHSPCDQLIIRLNQSHPLSKKIFVIHDQGWTTHLCGDADKFRTIMKKRHQYHIRHQYALLLDYFDQECSMYRNFDAIVCLSQDTYNLLLSVYGVKKEIIWFIPNGLLDIFKPILKMQKKRLKEQLLLNTHEKTILFVGRPTREKGVEALMRSFCQVIKQRPNIRLVIVGPIFNFEDQFKYCHSVFPKVIFMGQMQKSELCKWYRIADIGVLPSYYEQCSYVAIEMMMHCVPLVVSDANGLKSMFNNGESAQMARLGQNVKEYENHLTYAILYMLDNPCKAIEMSRQARNIYKNNYTEKQMYEGYKNLICSL